MPGQIMHCATLVPQACTVWMTALGLPHLPSPPRPAHAFCELIPPRQGSWLAGHLGPPPPPHYPTADQHLNAGRQSAHDRAGCWQGIWHCPPCTAGTAPRPRAQPITNRELLLEGALGLLRINGLRAAADGQATFQGCVYVTPEETHLGRQVPPHSSRPGSPLRDRSQPAAANLAQARRPACLA